MNMARSRRPSRRKGCVGCYDDGFCTVNRHSLCRECQAKRNKQLSKPAKDHST